jgi:tRNA (guanosine-2'-O-)-methyltransferase
MSFFESLAKRFVSGRRIERMRAVLAERTLWAVPVFENMHKEHNASAVIRSCDAFGVAEAHFIECGAACGLHSEISMGAHNWVRRRNWRNAEQCFHALRREGYVIVGTALGADAVSPDMLPLDRPLAFVFGNERDGLAPETVKACDLILQVPMRGFVESLNVSVAAALILYTHLERVRALGDDRWRLSAREEKRFLRRWIFSCTRVGGIVRKMRRQKRMRAGLPKGGDENGDESEYEERE